MGANSDKPPNLKLPRTVIFKITECNITGSWWAIMTNNVSFPSYGWGFVYTEPLRWQERVVPWVRQTEFRGIAMFTSAASYDIFVGIHFDQSGPVHNFWRKKSTRGDLTPWNSRDTSRPIFYHYRWNCYVWVHRFCILSPNVSMKN